MEYFNDAIIICSKNSKEQLLKSMKKLLNVKFFTMDEFIKNYCFDYDEKAILYLIKKYNIKYEIALEYLSNLIYIENKTYNNDKLDFLVNIKLELIENNLLIFNSYFKNYVKDKKIIIYHLSITKFEKYLLKDLNIEFINKKSYNYSPEIYEFETMDEELEYVALEISKLISNGVKICDIKLANVTDDYINTVTKIFDLYNLKIDKFNKIPILSTVIGNLFYSNLYKGLENAIESIFKYKETKTYEKIINICNKYVWCSDISDLMILIEYDLKHTYIDNIKYTNMIEVVDFKSYNFDDEYVFMLGFNEGIIPKLYKDEDFINDDIKPSYLDNTLDKNKKEKSDIIESIKNIKNLTITYKLKTPFNLFYPSSLIEMFNKQVVKKSIDYTISYSKLSNYLTLAKSLDDLIKFNKKTYKLNLLLSNYDIPYNTYRHSYTKIDKKLLQDYISSLKSFNLSYSSMDNYNRCAFRFFIDKILNLKSPIDKFSITLGNIYHYVLEKAIKKDINVKEEVDNYLKENDIILSNSNKFFVDKSIKNIEYLIDVLKYQKNFCNLNKVETEKFVKVPIKDNINFVGFIDKVVYDNINNETIIAIIDYKTYVKKPSLKYIKSGIGLQLPIYMYLSNHAYKNTRFVGFYLQNITLDNKSDLEKLKSLRLIGYTNKDKDILKNFDNNYMDSKVIDGIKVNNDGSFSQNSLNHMLTDEKIKEIIDITESKINETLNNILDAKFDINPKYDNENIGCDFCTFKDICFMKEYDFKNIKSNLENE